MKTGAEETNAWSPAYVLSATRGGLRMCGAPGWNLERGPFYIYKIVVNREKTDKRTEVFVLLKQKSLSKKKRIVS